jgi:hypothetical protein
MWQATDIVRFVHRQAAAGLIILITFWAVEACRRTPNAVTDPLARGVPLVVGEVLNDERVERPALRRAIEAELLPALRREPQCAGIRLIDTDTESNLRSYLWLQAVPGENGGRRSSRDESDPPWNWTSRRWFWDWRLEIVKPTPANSSSTPSSPLAEGTDQWADQAAADICGSIQRAVRGLPAASDAGRAARDRGP